MSDLLRRFYRDEVGATSIEYGLIAGFIGLAVITGAQGIATGLITIFGKASDGFDN